MDSAPPKPKVYRLRELPIHVDRLAAAELLSEALGDIAPSDIRIFSLATARHAERPATKTATLMFDKIPVLVRSPGNKEQWIVRIAGLRDSIILDTHFLGITQLNEVSDDEHRFE
jgi:hypothetical protein